MTEITTNGITTVISEVRGAEGLENTINNMRLFIQDIYTTEKFGLSADDLIQRQYAVITNLNDKKDFDEFNINDLLDFQEFVEVAGLDDYSYYTIAEYAYMYTKLLDDINEG